MIPPYAQRLIDAVEAWATTLQEDEIADDALTLALMQYRRERTATLADDPAPDAPSFTAEQLDDIALDDLIAELARNAEQLRTCKAADETYKAWLRHRLDGDGTIEAAGHTIRVVPARRYDARLAEQLVADLPADVRDAVTVRRMVEEIDPDEFKRLAPAAYDAACKPQTARVVIE